MRAVLQRVSRAEVRLPGGDSRRIGPGLVVLLGVGPADGEETARRLAEKVANLRIFSNAEGKFDQSLKDVSGEALVVSQFTLFGDCRKGRRPDFTGAASPEKARGLYEEFARALSASGLSVRTGEFGAKMEVELVNDGPVTLWLEGE